MRGVKRSQLTEDLSKPVDYNHALLAINYGPLFGYGGLLIWATWLSREPLARESAHRGRFHCFGSKRFPVGP